jgi:hypothetical protein
MQKDVMLKEYQRGFVINGESITHCLAINNKATFASSNV